MDSKPSSVLDHELQQTLLAASQVYVAALMGLAAKVYTGFEAWDPDGQHACLIGMGVQGLLAPEAFAVKKLSLDYAAYAVGVAVGSMTGVVPEEHVNGYLRHMGKGFATGRREARVAVENFETTGVAQ